MKSTRVKLEKSGKQRELHRKSRKRAGFKIISLAGYTSAGKTTLFNKMTGESNQRGEEMFTTLSTTIRRTTIDTKSKQNGEQTADGIETLISDTVGFISKLPAYMIDAFRSTLEELCYADVIVLVIDTAEKVHAVKRKLASCHTTLGELGISDERIIYALNKSDLLKVSLSSSSSSSSSEDIDKKAEMFGIRRGRRTVQVSARTGAGIAELKEHIKSVIAAGEVRRNTRRDKDVAGASLALSSLSPPPHKTVRKRDIGWSEAKEDYNITRPNNSSNINNLYRRHTQNSELIDFADTSNRGLDIQ